MFPALARRLTNHRALKTTFSTVTVTTPEASSRKGLSSALKFTFLAPVVALSGWILTSEHPTASAALALHFPIRLGRDVVCAASIVQDYVNSLQSLEGTDYNTQQRLCHLRSADKLQKLCFANGGIYIKLGQVAAQMDHLLPEEYVHTLRENLLDKCPVSTYLQVVRTIDEELGAPPSTLFAQFDDIPIASASLAQVHRAISLDGKELAVKVQHPGLRDTYAADVATVSLLVNLVHRFFPDFDYTWLVKEIKATLPKELDFDTEADNSDRCRSNFESSQSQVKGKIHLPVVHHALSSKRVLTMEYIEGVKVTDKAGLEQRGIQPSEVASIVSQAFNEMIFTFGDVHCDPHAANMLVRRDAHGLPQVVLLDHGLYKQIDDELRLEYAALWKALIFGDEKGIKRHTAKMNAGEMYPLFAAMLTSRPWEQITKKSADHLYIPNTAEERKSLQAHAKTYSKEINRLLGQMPPDLLLLLKTNECLRSVDLSLGQVTGVTQGVPPFEQPTTSFLRWSGAA